MQSDQPETTNNPQPPSVEDLDGLERKLIEFAEQARRDGNFYRKLAEEITRVKSEELRVKSEK